MNSVRAPVGEDRADAQLPREVIGGATRKQVGPGDQRRGDRRVFVACLHIQQTDIPFPGATVQLETDVNRNLHTPVETDVAAEKRNELLFQAGPEIELIGALQKKGTLFREEQRKAGDIEPPRIDFGLREISIESEHGRHLRSDAPGDVGSWLAQPHATGIAQVGLHFSHQKRADFNAVPLFEFADAGKSTAAAEIVKRGIECGRRPTKHGAITPDVALQIDAPGGEVPGEVQGIRGNFDLRRPTSGGAGHARIPDAIPVKPGSLRP